MQALHPEAFQAAAFFAAPGYLGVYVPAGVPMRAASEGVPSVLESPHCALFTNSAGNGTHVSDYPEVQHSPAWACDIHTRRTLAIEPKTGRVDSFYRADLLSLPEADRWAFCRVNFAGALY